MDAIVVRRCVHVQEQFSERGKSGGGESELVSLLFFHPRSLEEK